jgi:hypothetical protein
LQSSGSPLDELREKVQFCRVTTAGVAESHPHDVVITKGRVAQVARSGGLIPFERRWGDRSADRKEHAPRMLL